MAYVWRFLGKKNIQPTATAKFSIALILLILSFMLLAHAGLIAYTNHTARMIYPALSLMLMGAAEIFVDPVILTSISDAAPKQTEGRLVAIYYLAAGAIANYLAAKVANITIDPTTNTATAATYHAAYLQMTYIAGAIFLVFISWRFIKLRRSQNNELAYETY